PAIAKPTAQTHEPVIAPQLTQATTSRVLIVDDNIDCAKSLAELLRLAGHDVRLAHDGSAALELAQAFRPEAIVLDIGLPGMDGYEVARQLRARDSKGVVLVALTGYGRDEDRRRSLEAGFDHHLVKPVGYEALRQVLCSVGWIG